MQNYNFLILDKNKKTQSREFKYLILKISINSFPIIGVNLLQKFEHIIASVIT